MNRLYLDTSAALNPSNRGASRIRTRVRNHSHPRKWSNHGTSAGPYATNRP